jgi:hypothetical protein
VTGEWHNEKLHDLYSSPKITSDQLEENGIGGDCSTYWAEGKCIEGFGVEA